MLPDMNKPPVVKVDRPNFICPHCGCLASAPDAWQGAMLACPKCSKPMSNAKAEDRHSRPNREVAAVDVLLRIEKQLAESRSPTGLLDSIHTNLGYALILLFGIAGILALWFLGALLAAVNAQ